MMDTSSFSREQTPKRTPGFEVPMASRLYHPIKFNPEYSY